jgi:iron complex outermembrane receptor protein
MKKILFILSFIMSFCAGISQTKIIICDSLTKNSISDVQIMNQATKIIYFSGFDGSKIINLEGKNQLFLFTHLAYYNKKIMINGIQKDDFYIYLKPIENEIEKVSISQSRTNEYIKNSPYSISVYSNKENYKSQILSIDDFLKNSSAFSINRPEGIYSNSPIITSNNMGGVPGRTLVLFEGVPLNKADDGNVNWNMFSASTISKVEFISCSNSTIYGNNAMGGTISFFSDKPIKAGFLTSLRGFYGTYDTYGGEFSNSFRPKNNSGIYYNLNIFAQKSDGYITTPVSLQDINITYLPTFLEEIKANLILGYDFNLSNKIEIIYNFYDDKRSLGEKIQEENGSFTEHDSHFFVLKYTNNHNKSNFGVNLYLQQENYFKNIEALKNNNYSLVNVNSLRQDIGSNIYLNYRLSGFYKILSGINLRFGKVNGADIYQTSTDKVINSGESFAGDVFIQNQFYFFKDKNVITIVGGNYSLNYIIKPTFQLVDNTSITDFMLPFTGYFENNSYSNLSYNIGLRYNFLNNFSIKCSYNKGYNSPTLEDLTRSGLIRYGFKIANSKLQPEYLTNSNFGFVVENKNISFTTDFNYNLGDNFMYYIETGETIFDGKKKVIQKQNVTNVEMYGLNSNIIFTNRIFDIFANYSYNKTTILNFDLFPSLVGKKLMYSPEHKINAGLLFKTKYFNFAFSTHFFSEQFVDNENIEKIESYYVYDTKLTANISKNISLDFSVNNIFDHKYLINYDQLSLGRFMIFNLKYSF